MNGQNYNLDRTNQCERYFAPMFSEKSERRSFGGSSVVYENRVIDFFLQTCGSVNGRFSIAKRDKRTYLSSNELEPSLSLSLSLQYSRTRFEVNATPWLVEDGVARKIKSIPGGGRETLEAGYGGSYGVGGERVI